MSWTDFNDDIPTATPPPPDPTQAREAIRAALLSRLESVLTTLFPQGKIRRDVFVIGDVDGNPGRSLEVSLADDRAGLWTDRASGEGGDIFDLVAARHRLDAHHDFARVLELARDLVGQAPPASSAPRARTQEPAMDELGPATGRWSYYAADGALIAVVYRYDPPGGGKEFRPWDVKRRKSTPPSPRPLYNQPGIASAATIVLVEGEKCAQALIDAGICATTAMQGANAPVEKTDWSPLAGKTVLIWPDNDQPGRDYAVAAGPAVLAAGALSCAILTPPADRPEGWDAADAAQPSENADGSVEDAFDMVGFLRAGERFVVHAPLPMMPSPAIVAAGSSDDALATTFTRHYGDDWRYCAQWSQWLAWNGTRWNPDRTLMVLHLARGICRQAAAAAEKPSQQAKLASTATVTAVERLARTDRVHAATADEWDRQVWALNTPGGVVDLQTGQLRPHRRSDGMTKLATAVPRGECPIWRRFLHDVTGGDVDLQTYLQRMAGYCLTGVTSAHALFFLYGTGGNGKSVFVSLLAAVLGDYAAIAPMEAFMESRGERHPTDLAGLRSARFVAAQETEEGRRWNESKIKAITGGDKITARFMRQDFFEYVPQFKLVIAGNHKPSIRNVDQAMKRRLHLIPFTVTIPLERRDEQLVSKLLAERDGILQWALEGCLAWQRIGLKPPPCVLEATEEYFGAEDAHGRWQEEHCEHVKGAITPVRDLYESWKRWADACGEHVGSIKRFSAELQTRGFSAARTHQGMRAIAGITVKVRPFEPSDLDRRYDWN